MSMGSHLFWFNTNWEWLQHNPEAPQARTAHIVIRERTAMLTLVIAVQNGKPLRPAEIHKLPCFRR